MPGTFMNYPFDEEIFLMQWQAAQDPTRTAILNSGAVQQNGTIANMISNGSAVYTIPFYDVLGGDELNYDGKTKLTTDGTSGKYQSGVVYGRMKGWHEFDFVRDFGNNINPMQQIASQVNKYWAKKDQLRLLKIMDAVFATTDNTGGYQAEWRKHTNDICAKGASATAAPENLISETTAAETIQEAVGDNSGIFSLAFMHSKIALALAKIELLKFRTYTDPKGIQHLLNIADYNGMTVIVDDGVGAKLNNTSKLIEYPTYILGAGAIQYANAPVDHPVELWRDPHENGGKNELLTRKRETYHPNGFSFKMPGDTLSPSDVQLGDKANWTIAYKPKLIPMVKLVTNG